MLRTFGIVVIGALSVGLATAQEPAQREAAEKIIDRAIQAQGGPAQVARLQSVAFKGKTTLYLGDRVLSATGTFATQYPDCTREEMVTETDGRTRRCVVVVKGDLGFRRIDHGDPSPLNSEVLRAERLQLRQRHCDTLLPLKGKEFTLRLLGPAEIAGRKVVAVEYVAAELPTTTMFFDEQTSLLVKSQVKTLGGPNESARTSEIEFFDYRETDGVRHPSRCVTYIDGTKRGELLITEFSPGVVHPADTFICP
ncbi:MAG: hypothetical protein K2R98_07505 [Gemmataceae bacterium]|nr:hypothetical protein [Gemmataceae bacterium]